MIAYSLKSNKSLVERIRDRLSTYLTIGLNVVRSYCHKLFEHIACCGLHDYSGEPPDDAFNWAFANQSWHKQRPPAHTPDIITLRR